MMHAYLLGDAPTAEFLLKLRKEPPALICLLEVQQHLELLLDHYNVNFLECPFGTAPLARYFHVFSDIDSSLCRHCGGRAGRVRPLRVAEFFLSAHSAALLEFQRLWSISPPPKKNTPTHSQADILSSSSVGTRSRRMTRAELQVGKLKPHLLRSRDANGRPVYCICAPSRCLSLASFFSWRKRAFVRGHDAGDEGRSGVGFDGFGLQLALDFARFAHMRGQRLAWADLVISSPSPSLPFLCWGVCACVRMWRICFP
jgi:hypothetical protein